MSTPSSQAALASPAPSAVTVAHIVYALHALSLAIGVFTAHTVVGAFLIGPLPVIAVILNYVKRGDARGTWLESHYSWQIRTFWFAVLWAAVIATVSAVLLIVLVGFAIWYVGLFVLGAWAVVRVARGWLKLRDGLPIGR